jgi:hypothetical protein
MVTERKRAFYFKETANSLFYNRGALTMRCYFIRGGRVVGVSMLPLGISDEVAIASAPKLAAKRRGRIDGFEVWDGARLVIRHSARDVAPLA